MENVMVMSNNFVELSDIDMFEIEGGFDFWRTLGYAAATVCCMGACVVAPPLAVVAAGSAGIWYAWDAGIFR